MSSCAFVSCETPGVVCGLVGGCLKKRGIMAKALDDKVLLEFPTASGRKWPLRQSRVDRWQELYPTIDVLAECRRALAWCEAHEDDCRCGKRGLACERRKAQPGVFLVGWLGREVRQWKRREKLPAALPTFTPWVCPHVEEHGSRWECETATKLGRPRKE